MFPSNKQILNDFENWQTRLDAAKKKLSGLQDGYVSCKAYKKRKETRRKAETEIAHVKKLMKFARGCLVDDGRDDLLQRIEYYF